MTLELTMYSEFSIKMLIFVSVNDWFLLLLPSHYLWLSDIFVFLMLE